MKAWRPTEDRLWAWSGPSGGWGMKPQRAKEGRAYASPLAFLTVSIPQKASWGRERSGLVWEKGGGDPR